MRAQQRLSRDIGAGVLQLKVLAQRVGPDVQVALGALERPVRARPIQRDRRPRREIRGLRHKLLLRKVLVLASGLVFSVPVAVSVREKNLSNISHLRAP